MACAPPSEDRYLVNWGEAIHSLRVLLRRSTQVDACQLGMFTIATDKEGVYYLYQSRRPPPPGYDPGAYTTAKGVETPATTYPFSYTGMTPMAWIAAAFVGSRGSIRWHYNLVNSGPNVANSIQVVRRTATLSGTQQYLEGNYLALASAATTSKSIAKKPSWTNNFIRGTEGVVLTNALTQAGVSVEYPMMSKYLFQNCNPTTYLLGNSYDDTDSDTYMILVNTNPASANLANCTLERYCAAGTDFTLHFFLNSPNMYYNANAGGTPV